ncbi:2-keto-4-pentenoate hydratase [Gammaproteobacteria bacterium 42_54_T18]|nr:2-keto-4-pentenoate hydratase [Gammaproteobacteria bacterium 42_54_T18]
MKLATQYSANRDGQLLVVSRNMQYAIAVPDISPTLQYAIENWQHCAPLLNDKYQQLNLANDPSDNTKNIIDFTQCKLMSPLPRCYQWADGSAYVNHVELVRKARGAEMPDSFWKSPLMYQGGGDSFLGPTENIPLMNENWGLDLEAEIAIITDDVTEGTSIESAEKHIKLFMLVNDISLRNLIPEELAKGFGFFQSKPSSSFSPVAVTADELGDAWNGKKLHLPLTSHINDTLFGQPNAGIDMTFDFPTLVSHACKSRRLIAGSIIGSGTVSNYDRSNGSSCIAEKRMLEKIATGSIITPFLTDGDSICIEMFDSNGLSIFGAIKQRVVSQ